MTPPNYQNQNLIPHFTQCSAIFSAPDSCSLLRLSQVLLDCSWSNVSKSSKVCCPHTHPPPSFWQFPVGESAPATPLTALVRVLDRPPALVIRLSFNMSSTWWEKQQRVFPQWRFSAFWLAAPHKVQNNRIFQRITVPSVFRELPRFRHLKAESADDSCAFCPTLICTARENPDV